MSTTIPRPGARHRRKRVGCGESSGHGKTSGKGHKGQKARSGGSIRLGFEGGQMPVQRRLPARGFTSPNRTVYQIVSVGDIDGRTSADRVDAETLRAAGLIRSSSDLVKVLADGKLKRAVTVVADKFSRAAREKIEAAGGKVEERTGA